GSVTEKLFFFVAEYDPGSKASSGGGLESDGEDIKVLELKLDDALHMIASGEFMDGKPIMLMQYAQLSGLFSEASLNDNQVRFLSLPHHWLGHLPIHVCELVCFRQIGKE